MGKSPKIKKNKKHSLIPKRGGRPTVKCLIVQATGWTKVDLFFRVVSQAKRESTETIKT